MSGYLLDTNVVSELVSIKPNPRVLDWMEAADENLLYLSVMTLGEIRQGVAALPQSKKRTRLETWLELDLQSRFGGRILAIDGATADRWGWIMAQAQGKGMTLPVVDCLLAATAIQHNLTAVTRNVSGFAVAGLSVINPWEA
ncbi:MAG: type II toxin-antitoxin system VapC family toxin [Bryobacterales bacterium]|nr:type II toxin-antitoxin system VapC family toxin [Bryobacterales bacterium]